MPVHCTNAAPRLALSEHQPHQRTLLRDPARTWGHNLFTRIDAWLAARADELLRDVSLDEQWTFFEARSMTSAWGLYR